MWRPAGPSRATRSRRGCGVPGGVVDQHGAQVGQRDADRADHHVLPGRFHRAAAAPVPDQERGDDRGRLDRRPQDPRLLASTASTIAARKSRHQHPVPAGAAARRCRPAPARRRCSSRLAQVAITATATDHEQHHRGQRVRSRSTDAGGQRRRGRSCRTAARSRGRGSTTAAADRRPGDGLAPSRESAASNARGQPGRASGATTRTMCSPSSVAAAPAARRGRCPEGGAMRAVRTCSTSTTRAGPGTRRAPRSAGTPAVARNAVAAMPLSSSRKPTDLGQGAAAGDQHEEPEQDHGHPHRDSMGGRRRVRAATSGRHTA